MTTGRINQVSTVRVLFAAGDALARPDPERLKSRFVPSVARGADPGTTWSTVAKVNDHQALPMDRLDLLRVSSDRFSRRYQPTIRKFGCQAPEPESAALTWRCGTCSW